MKVSLILLLMLPSLMFGTAQAPDIIVIDGEEKSLFENPLDVYFERTLQFPDFEALFPEGEQSTACWRGYVATWEIREESLYLVKIQDCGRKRTLPMELLFPEHHGMPIRADWFSGYLRIPDGPLLRYEHMGYGSRFEREILMKLDSGTVKEVIPQDLGAGFVVMVGLQWDSFRVTMPIDFEGVRLGDALRQILADAPDYPPEEETAKLLRETHTEFRFFGDTESRWVSLSEEGITAYRAMVAAAMSADAFLRLNHDGDRLIVEVRGANNSEQTIP